MPANDDDRGRCIVCRRKLVAGLGGGALGALAGCVGGDGDGSDGSDGSDGTATPGDDMDGSDGTATPGDGDMGGSDKTLKTDPGAFDFANPNWEENNWTVDVLIENGYERGSREDLESIEPREEVRYGDPVQQKTDDTEILDPDTVLFSYSPSEETPQQFEDALGPLMENFEAETEGYDTEFKPLTSYAAAIEAMRAEQLHIINYNTGAVPFAVNLAGAVPEGIGLPPDGSYGYRLWAITQSDNEEIWSVEDFAGKRVAHSEPTSNSGNQAPRALFEQEFGVVPGEDYEVNYSGGHDQTTRGVFNGDYDCGPVCSSCARDVITNSDRLDGADIKSVWGSTPFPVGPLAYRYNLHEDIIEGFKRALYDYDYSGTAYEEGTDYVEHFEIDYATHWDVILTIQQFNDVEYEVGALSE